MATPVLRMLLILLSLLASAPAAAMPAGVIACHDAPAAMPMDAAPVQHQRAPDQAPPHACVGCVPLDDWLAPRLAAPIPLPASAPVARVIPLGLSRAPPPLLRPPRLG